MRQQLMIVLVAFSAALAGFALSVWISKQQEAPVTIQATAPHALDVSASPPAPRFTLLDLENKAHSLDDWHGKVVLINFWATWCPPCVHEIPELIRLQDELSGQGLQVVGISDESVEDIRTFMNKVAFNYPILRNPPEQGDLSINYGNSQGVLPYSVLIDRQGRIRQVYRGALQFDTLRSDLQPLLAESP